MVRKFNMIEKMKCQKLTNIFSKHLPRRKNCKTESSYNFENLKLKYCFTHK